MYHEDEFQDLVRCYLCDISAPHLHCGICDMNFCKYCQEIHLADESKKHKVMRFELRGCLTNCQKHSSKKCERYCKKCNIPVCEQCASSGEHNDHEFADVVEKLESQKNVLRRDLQELEISIYPIYEELASNILDQKAKLNAHSKKTCTEK